ncbi:protein-disulfide reductase DsbD [Mesorhizobium sp. BAC0120]|uniref:protein-disulfide reductase DsbD n=1 Tax=Mesorhizobium sp. BAC0120 TaxID=3090670 RepID=UPI00298CFCDB|nr:protein-disulfide reductase DsbD [Mesorhizobium sp. BAC0120]MDW6024740.1 protein-disulfide reductase DsbD [Mesorhizobium sp. BAC0120]
MLHLVRLVALLLAGFPILLHSASAGAQMQSAADSVFSLRALRESDGTLQLIWTAAPGNYLYRDSLKATQDGKAVAIGTPVGEDKDDPNFGRVEIYHGSVTGRIGGALGSGTLEVGYQGCAEEGICYPPIRKTVDLATMSVNAAARGLGSEEEQSTSTPAVEVRATASDDAAGASSAAFLSGNMLAMATAFLGFGLLLSLTPCVFPMIPILSAMLAGAGERLSMTRGLALSTSYVLAMAGAYGLVGLAAGWSGANLQTLLQTPLALSLAAAVFIVLALSMFDLFELSLPPALAARLTGKRRSGSLGGAALLGFGSALIVGPCVTPPLAAAMLYAVQTGEAARGAAALFFLGLGMGLPLIAVGTFGARILPRSGPWMVAVRKAFGAVFLGVAATLVARLLPAPAALALWGALAIGSGVFLGAFDRLAPASGWQNRLAKATGLVAAVYGAILLVGAASGADDPVRPLALLNASQEARAPAADVRRVSSLTDFEAALAAATASGRPAMISFTADWCTVCRSNETIMNKPAIRDRLRALPIIAADVTTQNEPARELMARFSVVGPPTLFLLDARGREIHGSRIVGPVTEEEMTRRLESAGL